MTHYQKGANFERELVNRFWSCGWTAVRVAGSGIGSSSYLPDVIAIKDRDVILLECKTTRKDRLSLKSAINSLNEFASISKSRAYIAIKFLREKPRFYDISEILGREGDYTLSLEDEYLSFDALIRKQALLTF